MTRHRLSQFLTLLTLASLTAFASACAKGSSPTEPDFDQPILAKSSPVPATADGSATVVTDESKRRGQGADDPAGDDRGGRRGNDQAGNRGSGRDQRGRGNDDNNRPNNNRPEDRPRAGQEFAGAVVSVGGNRLTLAGGAQVVVNGQTQWSARGDLTTLDQVARSVAAGAPTRVEGRGARQADGSLLAQTIKAEVDD